MLIMFMVVMGIFSFRQLGVDLFPKSDPATCFVRVQLPGASPEEVVSQVVLPLEDSIAAVSGIDELRAVVSEGNANIIVTFVLERDISEATEDVREKVSGAMRQLPPNVLPPTVQKADPDNDPVITLAVSGNRSVREMTEIADKQIRRALETVDGVAGVDMSGMLKAPGERHVGPGQDERLPTDPAGRADGLDQRERGSAGRPDRARRNRTGRPHDGPGGRVAEFSSIIVKNVNGAPIRIRDVGYAEDGTTEHRSFAFYRGKAAVVLDVRRQTGMNTVKVVEDVQKKIR